MKHYICLLLLTIALAQTMATPKFSSGRNYRIVAMNDNTLGGIAISTKGKLIYNSSKILNDSAYWKISKDYLSGNFRLKNSATGEYLQFQATNSAEGFTTVSSLSNTFSSTHFGFQLLQSQGKCYYAITSLDERSDKQCLTLYSEDRIGSSKIIPNANNAFLLIDAETAEIVEDDQQSSNLLNYFNSFTFDGKPLIQEKTSAKFYLPIKPTDLGKSISKCIEFEPSTEGAFNVSINGKKIVSGDSYTFVNVTSATEYTFSINQGLFDIAVGKIVFTTLPVVQLYFGTLSTSVYSPGKVIVNDPQNMTPPSTLQAKFRIRGALSSTLPKKSYAMKLIDETGNPIDKSFFGLREDNNWIFDAMTIDPLRMRNRVNIDLWNDFSTKPYYANKEPALINGTRGKFVEVLINDEYGGLYCMTEKIDRKQLKLKKFEPTSSNIRGELIKAADWSIATMMGYTPDRGYILGSSIPSYNNNSDYWSAFEMKYPDITEGEKINWEPFQSAIKVVHGGTDEEFASKIEQLFDIPVLIDYYLFIELLLAADNHGKNLYLSIYNLNESRQISFTPWDCDATWGIRWNGTTNWGYGSCSPFQDFPTFTISMEHGEYHITHRLLEKNVIGFKEKLATRYAQLRKTFFKPESILKRFTSYRDLIVNSGAGTREKAKWNNIMEGVHFESLETYLTDWIYNRIEFLDKQYGYSGRTAPSLMLSTIEGLIYGGEAKELKINTNNSEGKVQLTASPSGIVSIEEGNRIKPLKAGKVTIKAYMPETDEYLEAESSVTLIVEKRTLLAIVEDKQRYVGENNPAFTARYEGMAEGDILTSILLEQPTFSCSALPNSPEGSYAIRIYGGYVGSNYVLSYQPGTLTVVSKTILKGDSNGDGAINVSDVVNITNYIIEGRSSIFLFEQSDVNNDSKISVPDIVQLVNIILDTTTALSEDFDTINNDSFVTFEVKPTLETINLWYNHGLLHIESNDALIKVNIYNLSGQLLASSIENIIPLDAVNLEFIIVTIQTTQQTICKKLALQ